jgi:glucokinase
MYLGIEIGGTKLQLGVGEAVGRTLLDRMRLDIDHRQGAAGIRAQLQHAVPELIGRYPVRRIGIGFGGPVLNEITLTSHQIDGWEKFPLSTWCREQFGIPATLGNDCDVAALAEAVSGAGEGYPTVFYVTVGTGVGGGLVWGGKLHGRGRPAVAEIGHLRPGLQARHPRETVEAIASGRGIAESARQEIARHPEADPERVAVEQACAGRLELLTSRQLGQLATDGNWIARQAIDAATETLGWAIAQVVTITSADVVVVGGGVSLLSDALFWEPLRAQVATYVFPPLRDAYRIVPAALGEWVVVHGALELARQADQKATPLG